MIRDWKLKKIDLFDLINMNLGGNQSLFFSQPHQGSARVMNSAVTMASALTSEENVMEDRTVATPQMNIIAVSFFIFFHVST